MTTLLRAREQSATGLLDMPASALGLRADRTDISFENVTPDLVRVDVRVTNEGDLPSPPTLVRVQSAPLGAFLTWQPLLSLLVPSLGPRQSTVVSGAAWAPRPAPLGQPKSVTPAQVAEALQTPEPEAEAPAPPDKQPRSRRRSTPVAARDVFALMGRGGVHWAGNIDVLMRGKSVERHLARALRVYPGKTNAAMFFVGDRNDGYKFDLAGHADEWNAELLDMTGRSCLRPSGAPGVALGEWLELTGHSMFFLLLHPPVDAERGEVQVHVQRQSDGKEAVVEFSLDCRAAGTGCYTV